MNPVERCIYPTNYMQAMKNEAKSAMNYCKMRSGHDYSTKILILLLIVLSSFLLLFSQLQNLSSSSSTYSFPSSWTSLISPPLPHLQKLRHSVTFLPLKDIRYAGSATDGHTWFMSSMNDEPHEKGEVHHLHFPSQSSRGRLLCLKGRNIHDGAWNYYGLAWPEALPENATLKEGLTFVSYSHYPYDNIWHGLSATMPLAAWHLRNRCRAPARWVLYFKGEVRTRIPPWLSNLLQAVYATQPVNIEGLEGYEEAPVCFEEAVVTRQNEKGLTRERLEEVYDLLRCKARAHCNVSRAEKDARDVTVTMLLRTGARSFKNDTRVIEIFESECRKIEGCRLQVAYSNNLTVCQQVEVMSNTNVLISSHGAQQTNLFLMDKGSSVMEFYPKGWLKVAGVGQYVYKWLSEWSGMHHQGAWRDSEGPPCQYSEDDFRCFSVYKDAQIGHNETHFRKWANTVFSEARARKVEEIRKPKGSDDVGCGCA